MQASDTVTILEDGERTYYIVGTAHVSKESVEEVQRVIDPYGARDEAEFFAVATESFFERPVALRDADLRFARELLRATGNVVALSVFNTVARVLSTLPVVAEAMYAQPSENAAGMLGVLRALSGGAADAGEVIEALLAETDARTLSRFEALLRAHHKEEGVSA